MTKYTKIYNHVLNNYIKKLEINDMIPFELDLAEEFQVSRMTVNKAINSLVDEGYLKRIKGKGTFIVAKSSNNTKDLGELYSYSEDMQKRNVKPVTKILDYEYIEKADDDNIKIMGLNEDDSLHKIVRLRYLNEKPISIDYTFISTKYVEDLDYSKLSDSMLVYYEKEMGIKIGYEDQEIKAAIADSELSGLLQIETGSPLLRIDGCMTNQYEEVFEHSIVYYVSDAYKLKKRAYRPNGENNNK